ncbi:hypothetical protein HanRHA438_CPg0863501 (chloroplast) [Helianthus annuus]|nr:hypothetical protein HanRHA438_CPg0863501 [Helianthus annuus]
MRVQVPLSPICRPNYFSTYLSHSLLFIQMDLSGNVSHVTCDIYDTCTNEHL